MPKVVKALNGQNEGVLLDISEFNEVTSWDTIKEKTKGVLIRIGLRGSLKEVPEYYGKIRADRKAAEFINKCVEYGIPFGVYFFPTSISLEEAQEEAHWILNAITGLELSFPVFLDTEMVDSGGHNGRADKLSAEDRTRFLNAILEVLMAAGVPCGVYASESWFRSRLNDQDILEGAKYWVAQWADGCWYTGHDIYAWQFGSRDGYGTKKPVDTSFLYGPMVKFTYKAPEKAEGSGDLEEEAPKEDPKPEAKPEVVKSDMNARLKVSDIMVGWHGRKESNGTHRPIIDIYNDYLPTAVKAGCVNYRMKYTDSWCAAAVSAAFIKAGYGKIFPVECSCPRMVALAKKMGIWEENDNYVPKISEAVLYDWQDSGAGDNQGNPDHIGLVIAVNGRSITVEEGNRNDDVSTRILTVGGRYIRGYIRPKFDSEAVSAPVKGNTGAEVKKPSKTAKCTGEVTASKLNVRTWAGTENKVCSFSPLKRGVRLEVCDTVYDKGGAPWYYIRWRGLYGFVSAQYVKLTGRMRDA